MRTPPATHPQSLARLVATKFLQVCGHLFLLLFLAAPARPPTETRLRAAPRRNCEAHREKEGMRQRFDASIRAKAYQGGRDSLRRMNGLVVEHFDPAAIPISNPLTIPLSRIDRL